MKPYTYDTLSIPQLKRARDRDRDALLALLPEIDRSTEMEQLFVATAARYAQTIIDLQHAALTHPRVITIHATTGEPAIDDLVASIMADLTAAPPPEPEFTFD